MVYVMTERMKVIFFLSHFFLSLMLVGPSFAAEVDHYTVDYRLVPDATDYLNNLANTYLLEALDKANEEGESCHRRRDENRLYRHLRHYFANHQRGVMGKDLISDENLPRHITPLAESVYQDWKMTDGFLLGRPSARRSPLALGPMFRIGEFVVGTDKIEHLFGMGHVYFRMYYRRGRTLTQALKRGVKSEKSILGGNRAATGVFAYADLSANFNGMRFWNHMLLQNEDVLGPEYNRGPYIICGDNGKWEQGPEQIDFRSYVDISMDESVNCSKFASGRALKKFRERVSHIRQEGTHSPHHCFGESERSKQYLEQMLEKYSVTPPGERRRARPISHWILNLEGHGKVSYLNEF